MITGILNQGGKKSGGDREKVGRSIHNGDL